MSDWARHKGDETPKSHGPFASDMPPPRGVSAIDMPLGRPAIRQPKIKGVPAVTPDGDEDYQPGNGNPWQPVQ